MSEMDIQPVSALHYGVQVATSAGQLTASVAHSTAFHGGSSVMLAVSLTMNRSLTRPENWLLTVADGTVGVVFH